MVTKYRSYLYISGIPKCKRQVMTTKVLYGDLDGDTHIDHAFCLKARKYIDTLKYRDVNAIELVMFKIINNNEVDLNDRLSFRVWSKEL